MIKALPDSLAAKIDALAEAGDSLEERGEGKQTLSKFRDAWDMISDEKAHYAETTWVATAMVDNLFMAGRFVDAKPFADYVMHCPDAVGNPFVHLRRGQVLFELGELYGAAIELIRAYGLEGDEIFTDEDPNCRAFLATRARIDPEPAKPRGLLGRLLGR